MSDNRPASATQPAPGANPVDDIVLPFRAEASGVMGRLIRFGPVVDTILARHDYPEPVSLLLGEAIVLTAMLGATLKSDSRLILQTKTDGAVPFLVVNYEAPGKMRGYASFDKARIDSLPAEKLDLARDIVGKGHLAMTIDPGVGMESYQGLVPIENESLTEAALTYFKQSEQLPTFIRLSVARHFSGVGAPEKRGWHWRAGGIIIQHLSPDGGRPDNTLDRIRGDGSGYDLDDGWERTRILASTVQDHELLDPTLRPDRLLFRLFHEEGVWAYPTKAVEVGCNCSRERLGRLLGQFSPGEIEDLVEPSGKIEAKCEFCNTTYSFSPNEIRA